MKCNNYLLVFMFMLMLNCNLNAQEASTEKPSEPKTVLADVLDDAGEELDKVLESSDATSEDEDEVDEDEVDEDEADEEDVAEDEADEDEADDELDEDEADDELDEEETEEHDNAPISIRIDEDGKLVGQALAFVGGRWVPVEATMALVNDDVLLDKIVAEEDGSFSFPDIVPGSYKVYGTAASFCGQRAVTVLSESGCCDNVDLGLRQDSPGACYSELGSAPAATFSEAPSFSGGFASGGPVGGGGGFATGGGGGFVASGGAGVASGFPGLRLLAVGGIATAIAVSDDDNVATPSE